jgi:hypothetical protein
MAATKMDRARLHQLQSELPATKSATIASLWPDIKAALNAGHKLTVVHARLTEIGILISYNQLAVYVGRLRQRDAQLEQSPAPLEPPKPAESEIPSVSPSAGLDPLANFRQRTQKRSGFRHEPDQADLKKLV